MISKLDLQSVPYNAMEVTKLDFPAKVTKRAFQSVPYNSMATL